MDKPAADLETFDKNDPMEAIFALNIGDFVTDAFISDDLLNKISESLASDPEKLKRQLEELIQIYSLDKTLGILGFDADEDFVVYDSIAATLANMFQVDACHLFQIAHKETGTDYLSLTGSSLTLSNDNRWNIGLQVKPNDLLSDAYQDMTSKVAKIADNSKQWHPIDKLGQDKTKTLLTAPLYEGEKRLGLIVFETYSDQEFGEELIALSDATADVFVTSIRLQRLISQAQRAITKESGDIQELQTLRAEITESIADLGTHQQTFVETLGGAIDARHAFTKGHSKYVAQIAKLIAEEMDLNEKTIDLIYYAGLLGNLGKINIPQEILAKRDSLSRDEWDALRNSSNVGVGLLVQINFISEVIPYVHYQHERWNGSGSPEGLAGKNIPLGSRILAVADAVYAMTQERPYRQEKLSYKQAIDVLRSESGSKWDPAVVDFMARIPAEFLP